MNLRCADIPRDDVIFRDEVPDVMADEAKWVAEPGISGRDRARETAVDAIVVKAIRDRDWAGSAEIRSASSELGADRVSCRRYSACSDHGTRHPNAAYSGSQQRLVAALDREPTHLSASGFAFHPHGAALVASGTVCPGSSLIRCISISPSMHRANSSCAQVNQGESPSTRRVSVT